MSSAARSIVVFGVYLGAVGASLLVVPELVLPLMGFPATGDVWVRVAGVLVLLLAYADLRLGPQEAVAWFRVSVHTRILVFVSFGALVLLGLAPRMLAAFGAVDLAGAIWTAAALRSRKAAVAAAAS